DVPSFKSETSRGPMQSAITILTGNLPAEPNGFIGRERDLADLAKLLGEVRALTLSGPGGIGKTRLAVRLAREVIADGEDSADPGGLDEAWLVELADWPGPVAQQVTMTLGIREPLRVRGETVWRVPPLDLPPEGAPGDELADHEAVRLFAARAAEARPGFTLTEGNAASVARLCRTLDGIPLGIELSAARVRALSVEQIEGRLRDRFALLNSGDRTAPRRQQTLRAT